MYRIHNSFRELYVKEKTRYDEENDVELNNGYYEIDDTYYTSSPDILKNEVFVGKVKADNTKQLIVCIDTDEGLFVSHNNIRKYIEDETNYINDSLIILDRMSDFTNLLLDSSYLVYNKEIK